MNFFEKSLNYNGYDLSFAKAALERFQSIPDEQYEDYIENQKKIILTHHLMHGPFYKSFVGTDNTIDWEEVPVLTKSDLQQNISSRLTEGYTKQNIYLGKTSGSSGVPFTFAKCKASHALSWASFYDRYAWYDINLSTSKQARFYGIPLDFIGYRKELFKDWLGNRYRFPIFNLNENNLEKILKKFKKRSFQYINGYTTSIVLFAKFLKEKELVLSHVCPSLKVCIVTSEMLFDDDRKLLETQLGIPIINEYGASEIGLIAFQNQDGKLQADSELLHLEILDKNNKNVPLGETGRIVITSFYNKAHPMIRYDIGDMGALSKDSTPRFPLLEKLEGRTSDIAQLPSGKIVPGLTFYYVTKTIIQEDNNVKEFVIDQTKKDTFIITYVAKEELTAKEKIKISQSITTYLEQGLTVHYKRVELLQRSKSGKLKQFSSAVI